MEMQTGLSGDKHGRPKRKLSGDIAECGSDLDLFSLQRELLLTQNELRLLRQQYFQLRHVCQESMQVMESASNFSVFSTKADLLARQPGVWKAMSVPVAKRRAILDQVRMSTVHSQASMPLLSMCHHGSALASFVFICCQLKMLCTLFDSSHLTALLYRHLSVDAALPAVDSLLMSVRLKALVVAQFVAFQQNFSAAL